MKRELLISIPDAAVKLGVGRIALQTAAEEHGFLIRIGRSVKLKTEELEELIDLCRNKPKAPASTAVATPAYGSSVTPGGATALQALETASKLKGRSRSTSPKETAPVVPLQRKR